MGNILSTLNKAKSIKYWRIISPLAPTVFNTFIVSTGISFPTTSATLSMPPTVSPTLPPNQDIAMCDFTNSTNINTITGYGMWKCTDNVPLIPVCTPWYGVTCNIKNNVNYINLSNIQLTGTLSTT